MTATLQNDDRSQPARYDGIAQSWANTKEDLMVVFASPFYVDVVNPDESKFIEEGKVEIYVGDVEDYWVTGSEGMAE